MVDKILTADELRATLVYDPDTGVFTWRFGGKKRTAGAVAGSVTRKGYLRLTVDYKHMYAHRAAWLYVYGEAPPQIDHINRDRLDNRLANLRPADALLNGRNRSDTSSSRTGVRGVSLHRNGRYRAEIRCHYKTIHIGYFSTLQEAVAARKKAEAEFWI